MHKKLVIWIAILVLVLCFVLAHYAERANDVPTQPIVPTTAQSTSPQTSAPSQPAESSPKSTIPPTEPKASGGELEDLENGLGWG